jgi:hypothetical protein
MMRGAGGLGGLLPAERMQIMAFLMMAERTWEALFVQYHDGMIDEELWRAHSRQAQAALNDNPLTPEFWRLRREFFMPAYREFRDAQVERKGGSDTLGYGTKAAPPMTSSSTDEAHVPSSVPPSKGAQQ